jgi:hypothetical protein
MSTALTTAAPTMGATMEKVLLQGDLAKLSPDERLSYYNAVCNSVGLNPLTQPFAYIQLNGKLTLYARKDCTDQLRQIHSVSIIDLIETERDGVYVVTAKAQNATGRIDMAKGAVSLSSLKGEALANAIMKAETKAKRRVTLSICGLGFLDETEVDSIPNAQQPKFAEPAGNGGNGHTVTEIKPPKINKAMAEKLRDTVIRRKMPPPVATAIFQQFGFAKSTDVTEDIFNEVLQALCDWQADLPETEPPATALTDPEAYGAELAAPDPQPDRNDPPPVQRMTEKESLKEKRKEIDSYGQQLLNAGVPMHTIQSLMESKTCVRESKYIENTSDANALLVAMETLLEQATAAKKQAAKKKA